MLRLSWSIFEHAHVGFLENVQEEFFVKVFLVQNSKIYEA